MDLLSLGLGVDLCCSFALYMLHKRYTSVTNTLSQCYSLSEFYDNHVIVHQIVDGGVKIFKDGGCDVIVSGQLVSVNDRESNKIFNDVVVWTQSIFEYIRGGNAQRSVSCWIKWSPLVVLNRKYGWLWQTSESVVVCDPAKLDGMERLYEVVVDNYVREGETGLRAVDKMVFSGTAVTIHGWLSKDANGHFTLSSATDSAFQISSKSSSELADEVNPHRTLISVLSFAFNVSVVVGAVLTLVVIVRRIRNRNNFPRFDKQ